MPLPLVELALAVEDGTLRFVTGGFDELPAGDSAAPYQMVPCFLLQPGTTVSHDALRLLASRRSSGGIRRFVAGGRPRGGGPMSARGDLRGGW